MYVVCVCVNVCLLLQSGFSCQARGAEIPTCFYTCIQIVISGHTVMRPSCTLIECWAPMYYRILCILKCLPSMNVYKGIIIEVSRV